MFSGSSDCDSPVSVRSRPRGSSAPSRSNGHHGRKAGKYPGALSWLYEQPDVDDDRRRTFLRARPKAELKLRLALKIPIAEEMPTEEKHGWERRIYQLERLQTLIDKAEKALPSEAAVLEAGRRRLERIRGLPLKPIARQAAAEADLSESTGAHDALDESTVGYAIGVEEDKTAASPSPSSSPALAPSPAPAAVAEVTRAPAAVAQPNAGKKAKTLEEAETKRDGASAEAPDEWAKATLEAHNAYRGKHGVPPLAWSNECFEYAMKQAAKMEQLNGLDHDNMDGPSGRHGQNCFGGTGSGWTAHQAVKAWYDELTDPGYDFAKQGFSMGTGHFTQVVWKETRFVGMARSENGGFIAANYFPAGNMAGQFEKNVFPEGTAMQARADPKLGTFEATEWSEDILKYLEGCPFADKYEPKIMQAIESGQTVVIDREEKSINIKLVSKGGASSSMGGPW